MSGPHDTPEFKTLAAENDSDATIRKGRWASLKEEFIDAMLTGKPFHWPTMSAKYGFLSQTARNKASSGKWYAEIEQRRKVREEVLDKKLTERTHMALDTLNKDFATNEAAIRARHATIGRGLQSKAIGEIGKRDLTKASLSDLLRMVELGIREERFAMGLPDVAEAPVSDDETASSEFKPLQEQVGGHKKLQAVGALLLKELQKINKGTIPVQDVEAKPSKDKRVYAGDAVKLQSTAPAPTPKPKAKIVVKSVAKKEAA